MEGGGGGGLSFIFYLSDSLVSAPFLCKTADLSQCFRTIFDRRSYSNVPSGGGAGVVLFPL